VTDRQRAVLAYLTGKDWTSPTDIGRNVWGWPHHSATASPVCKRMVAIGLLERNSKGLYRRKA
jgi:hypothetical protein